jgi:hypothetical protein
MRAIAFLCFWLAALLPTDTTAQSYSSWIKQTQAQNCTPSDQARLDLIKTHVRYGVRAETGTAGRMSPEMARLGSG